MAQTRNIRLNGEGFVANDKFLRRIPPMYLKKTGEISSAAFQNASGTNSFSTNWMKLSSVEDTLRNYLDFGVASVSAPLSCSFPPLLAKERGIKGVRFTGKNWRIGLK